MNATNIFASLFLSSIGVGYFIYGKRQQKPIPLFAGLILIVFPYFVSNIWWMLLIGVAAMLLPLLIRI